MSLAELVEAAEEALGGADAVAAVDPETARQSLNALRYAAPGAWRVALEALSWLGPDVAAAVSVEDVVAACVEYLRSGQGARELRCSCAPARERAALLQCAGIEEGRAAALRWAFRALCARGGAYLLPNVTLDALQAGCMRLFLHAVIRAALSGVRG